MLIRPFNSEERKRSIEREKMNSDICQDCGDSVSFGSGKFVNRIPANDWLCAECASLECDRCDDKIPLDEDYYIEATDARLCHSCITPEELQQIEDGID